MVERKLCWRVTRKCNLRCRHCLAGHVNRVYSELDRQQRMFALGIMIAAGVSRVTWTGGEPTLCNDLPWLLSRCNDAGIASVITTHGLAIRDRWLQHVDPMKDRIRISFDGLAATHNRIRGGDYFDRALIAVQDLATRGFTIEANVTLLPETLDELPDLAAVLLASGVSRIILMTLMLRESAIDNALVQPDRTILASALRDMKTNRRIVGSIVHSDYGDPTDRYVVVESDGTILLCSDFLDRSFGLVTEDDGLARLGGALDAQTLAHRRPVRGGP